MTAPLLEVRALSVHAAGGRSLLDGVGFDVAPGERIGVVGASGAGKSTLGNALLRLLPEGVAIGAGASVRLGGEDLLALDAERMRRVRGRRIAMVFQEPLRALDPAMPVGAQLREALEAHGLARGAEAEARVRAMLARVGIADAREAAARFPHEFSGGMRQRLLIAAALLPAPALLVADEPTTALDATIQAQVLDLVDELRAETGTALLLISHDLDVVGERCDRILVLDAGRLVEDGPAAQVVAAPGSDAGRRLAAARAPNATPKRAAAPDDPGATVLAADDLTVLYRERRRARASAARSVRAVDAVSLRVGRGEALGVVGESGCGKSSLALALLQLVRAERGRVRLGDDDLLALRGEPLRRARRRAQLIPQDAGASLTPHLTAEAIVAEGLEVHGLAAGDVARASARALLAEVGLPARAVAARPAELSAGERQRVAIARALGPQPELLVCDEPVASVDAPTRALLLDLLDRLRRDRGLALLFISHDLAAVRRVADRVLVMYAGRVVEEGPAMAILDAPGMPYTQALLSAVPTGTPEGRARRIVLPGEPPSPLAASAGCPFHPRCPHPMKDATCANERPPLRSLSGDHRAACHKA